MATATLNRAELDRLEKRELQLTILAVVFVLVLAGGLAAFMYPLVFLHPVGNKWTLRVAFFGFCGLTLLFVGYLLEHQRTVRKLKQQLLAELERNVTLQHQASVDLLASMPGQNHFWDRLTMEFRRAMTKEKNLSLLVAHQSKTRMTTRPGATQRKRCLANCAPPIQSTASRRTPSRWFCRRRMHSTQSASPCACRKSCRTFAVSMAKHSKSTPTIIRRTLRALTNWKTW